jgi:hypothetical protein
MKQSFPKSSALGCLGFLFIILVALAVSMTLYKCVGPN